eukprot:13548867-Alexandrium_andersonii.AAC.1
MEGASGPRSGTKGLGNGPSQHHARTAQAGRRSRWRSATAYPTARTHPRSPSPTRRRPCRPWPR